jgi:hypothetical protein
MQASRKTFEVWAFIPSARRRDVLILENAGAAVKTELKASVERPLRLWYIYLS